MNPASLIIIWSLTFFIPPQDMAPFHASCQAKKGNLVNLDDTVVKFHETPWMSVKIYNCEVPQEVYCLTHKDNPICQQGDG